MVIVRKSDPLCVHVLQGSPAGPSSRGGLSAGIRPVSLGHSGAAGPRPITQSELATALALASTPDSSAVTPTTANQVRQKKVDQFLNQTELIL